ncbi:Golgi transport complex subunit 6, partial [Exophiala xenobiotica]
LVEILATSLLENSGIRDLMQELDTRRSHETQTRRAWLNTNLDDAAQRLDDFLSSALMDAQESLKNLLDRTLAINVVSEAVERFCSEFDELEGMLDMVDAKSGGLDGGRSEDGPDHVGSLRELYPRTGAEVRALLS